jgi:hypothetical protein
MQYLTRATVAVAAVVAATSLVSTALAVQPKPRVYLTGKTSMPHSLMTVKVFPSGKQLSVQLPNLSGVSSPQLKNVKVSDTGRFSVTRKLDQSGGNYAATKWTLTVSGTFTAPTKANGTFSMTKIDPDRGGGDTRKSGRQTFKLTFYKYTYK